MVDRREEVAHGTPRGVDDVIGLAAVVARVVVDDVQIVVHTQMREYVSQEFGRVVAGNLFERVVAVWYILGVVVSFGQEEHLATVNLVTYVAIVDVLGSAQHIADGMAREVVRLDAVGIGLREFYYHRLLTDSGMLMFHRVVIKIFVTKVAILDELPNIVGDRAGDYCLGTPTTA